MTYKVKQSSLGLFTVILLAVTIVAVGICTFLYHNGHNHQLAYILSFAVLFSLLTYIPRLLSSTDTQITLTNNGIEQTWVRQFLFQQKKEILIQWEEIADYVFEPHRQFDQFKLHLKNGAVFRMFHNHDHDNDDFKNLVRDFVAKVQELNTQLTDKSDMIQEGKKTYTWQTWALGSCAVFITIFSSVLLITHSPKTRQPFYKWSFLIGGYLLGMFILITNIWKLKKQKTKK